jgi:phospholipid/cholesterol/gamma-HCH transport system substrate-binding protein
MTTRWLAAVVTAAVVTLTGYVFADGRGDGDEEVELVAVFSDASPLVAGNVVKASGVDVGKITDVALRDGKAHVTMRIDPRVLPLHQDATATITTQDLLGERFVLLKRGTPESPAMGSSMTIPVEHTSRVVDLQDVLDSVDTPTSVALAALLTDTGEGLRGEGKQADKAIAALAPAMRQAKDLTAILDDQNALLTRLIDNAQPVASALASNHGAQLDELVDSTTRSLEVVASERAALRTALAQLPQTITSSRAALAQLSGAAEPARRTLAALRPVTDDLGDISGELKRFSDAADPALGSLPPVLRRADKLLAQAGPVVKALRPAARDLVPTSAAAAQLMTQSLSGKSLTDLLEFVKGWSMATSDYDAISHYFKAMVPLSPNALGDDAAALVPILPDDILHGLPMPTAPQLPNDGKPGSSVPLPSPGSADDGLSSTGLSQQQESSLVEQLIGGLL